MQKRNESLEENLNRTNYRIADNIDYLDGDRNNSFDFAAQSAEDQLKDKRVYNFGGSSLISNRSRVYKAEVGMTALTTSSQARVATSTNVRLGFHRLPMCHGPRGNPIPFSGQ